MTNSCLDIAVNTSLTKKLNNDGDAAFRQITLTICYVLLVQDVPNSWNANVCFNFCDEFLQYVKDTVQMDYDR